MDTNERSSKYVRQARFLHLAIYWIALLLALAYWLICFLLGSRPNALLQSLWAIAFLASIVFVTISVFLNELGWTRRILPPLLFILALFCAGQTGFKTRVWRFQKDLPRLKTLVSEIKAGHTPAEGTLTGTPGHRQLVVVVGGYYMTEFMAYIWCEDGRPPTSALRYTIDERDSIYDRGSGWYEAMVSNGH